MPNDTKPAGFLHDLTESMKRVALPAAGIAIGGSLADKVLRSAGDLISKHLAYHGMNKYLQELPEERRNRLIGLGEHRPGAFKQRFMTLYRLSPTLMKDPSLAAGLVSETLRDVEDVLTPDLADRFVQMERSYTSAQSPGTIALMAKDIGRDVGQDMAQSHFRERQLALAEQKNRIDQADSDINKEKLELDRKHRAEERDLANKQFLARTLDNRIDWLHTSLKQHGEEQDQALRRVGTALQVGKHFEDVGLLSKSQLAYNTAASESADALGVSRAKTLQHAQELARMRQELEDLKKTRSTL